MYTCEVLYNHGKVMVSGCGSTKRQAERNVAVLGLKWFEENAEEMRRFTRKANFSQRATAKDFVKT